MIYLLNDASALYQWDSNREVAIDRTDITEMHFCRKRDSKALVVNVRHENNATIAFIPNLLLQTSEDIIVYAYQTDYTVEAHVFEVVKRAKPDDYAYTETEIIRVSVIEEQVQKKLDRIYLDNFGYGADPSWGSDAYDYVGTQAAAYVEHYGSDGQWRPMLYRISNGDTEDKLKCNRIPITDSAGRLKVVAPDGTVSTTDSQNSAIPQHYGDARYVRTFESSSTTDRAYIKTAAGANSSRPISATNTEGTASIPIRDKTSQNFHVGFTTQNTHPINAQELVDRLSLETSGDGAAAQLVYYAPKTMPNSTKEADGRFKKVIGEIPVVSGGGKKLYRHEIEIGSEIYLGYVWATITITLLSERAEPYINRYVSGNIDGEPGDNVYDPFTYNELSFLKEGYPYAATGYYAPYYEADKISVYQVTLERRYGEEDYYSNDAYLSLGGFHINDNEYVWENDTYDLYDIEYVYDRVTEV